MLSLGRGAKNCTLREPCTEQDYYEIHTACDSEHRVCITCTHKVFFTRKIVRKGNNHSTLNGLIVVASGACIMLKSDLTHRLMVRKVHMNILCKNRKFGIIHHYQSQVHETTKFFSQP